MSASSKKKLRKEQNAALLTERQQKEQAEAKKLKVIKEVKDIAGLSLGEAKELVTSCPKMVKTGISKEEAEALKKQLEEVGATITIK